MTAHRRALIVAIDEYADAGLRRLRAPASDAAALAEALAEPGVGDFDVEVVHNGTAQEIRLSVEELFTDAHPDDLLLMHFSGHGLKNAGGELFLAAADSRPDRLASTAVAADFVNRQMAESRAQRIALFLDCCYGGAFPRGMVVRGAGEVQVREAFAATERSSGGRGRVVVTASSAVEYAFEGAELAPGALPEPSVFTGALVRGLTTGDADRDGDGWVGLHELFGYVTEQVRRSTPHQTPHLWAFGSEGELLIAHSGRRTISARTPAAELLEAARSPLPATRLGVALELREQLVGMDVAVALGAWETLTRMLGDDSRRVDDAVQAALAECTLRLEPPELLGIGGDPEAVHEVQLVGPPLVRAATVAVDRSWLRATVDDGVLRVTVAPDTGAASLGHVQVVSPVGEQTLPVSTRGKARGRPAALPQPDVDDGGGPTPAPTPAPAPVPVRRAPVDVQASARSTPIWIAVCFVVLLVGLTVACLGFVTWTSAISDGGTASSRASAIPSALVAVLVVASVVRPALGSVALGGAAGTFVAYLGFGLFMLMSGLGYDTDAPRGRAIVVGSVVGVLLVVVALVLRADFSTGPGARPPSTAVVLFVLGLVASFAFPFTGEHDATLAHATAWYLVLPATYALVVGSAVLARRTGSLGKVLDATAYALLAVSTFQVLAWLLRNSALDVLALIAVLGAALQAGAVVVNARARTGTRQAGP
jgi:hypothetical protein